MCSYPRYILLLSLCLLVKLGCIALFFFLFPFKNKALPQVLTQSNDGIKPRTILARGTSALWPRSA